jgi:flagellum-specific peptidoglycan hydrolase FlgJ
VEESEAGTVLEEHEAPLDAGQDAEELKAEAMADPHSLLGPKAQVELADKKQARADERAWREQTRAEERAWRDQGRADDRAWREQLRAEDADTRQRTERNARLYSALSAAAESAGPGSSTSDVLARAEQFLDWLRTRAREH